MTKIISAQQSNFDKILQDIHDQERSSGQDIAHIVRDILADIRQNKQDAILKYTRKFDNPKAEWTDLLVSQADMDEADKILSPDVKQALKLAYDRILSFHQRQVPTADEFCDDTGTILSMRYTPIDAAGVYIPGGAASYPSSVLMNILPAQAAGVGRIVAVVPAPLGVLSPAVLYALKICGVEEIYKIGGAQAIGALAYGTQSIKSVDKITGPGNAFVAEAKKQVYGHVGIDSIAGPSEILVIADHTANPKHIAMDLLSQAEHDPLAQSILITTCSQLAKQTEEHIHEYLGVLQRKQIAKASWDQYGVIILTDVLEHAAKISNQLAPEHLELCIQNPRDLLPFITHAGAIFIGHHTPEAIGDYIGGPNHVLPTNRNARFSSGLGTVDFMKRTTMIECTKDSFKKIAPAAAILAEAEGLEAHGLSLTLRL